MDGCVRERVCVKKGKRASGEWMYSAKEAVERGVRK